MLTSRDSVPDYVQTANVLYVEPDTSDRDSLHEIFARSQWPMFPQMKWKLETRSSIEAAMSALRRKSVAILMCESRPDGGTWREMLELASFLSDPPLLIVTSRTADEGLWAEALNRGAYDVLAKPFDPGEVVRIVSVAWLTWQEHHAETPAPDPPHAAPPPPAPATRVIRGPASRPRG